jgi:hypothetical protein
VTAAGLAGGAAALVLLLGVGSAPSVLQLAGANEDVSGNCDEAEHAGDPECGGTTSRRDDDTTSTTVDDSTSTTLDGSPSPVGGTGAPVADDVRSLDAAGAGTVIYAVESGTLRLVSATPAPGWVVEVEQGAGREVELDFRSGTRRVQVNLELEDGQVRERVRVRDDADDTDVRSEDGVVQEDNSGHDDDDSSGSGHDGSDDDTSVDDDHRGSGHHGSDDDSSGSGHDDDDSSGPGRDHPEDD